MNIIFNELDSKLQSLETNLQLAEEQYYTENDFLVIKEQSKDKLIYISKDIDFLTKLVNFYPGYGSISILTKDYSILFVCNKNITNDIKNYLFSKYGNDLEIGEVIEPITNGENICEYYKSNIVQF
jgi:hypothetical protein